MPETIEMNRQTLEPFFTKLYGLQLSFVLLKGNEAANLQTFIENPNRPGLQSPLENVRKVLQLLKEFDFNSPEILNQLITYELTAYRKHLSRYGFRFDKLTTEDIHLIKTLLQPDSSHSTIPSAQVTEIVRFLKSRGYDITTFNTLNIIDLAFDQTFLTRIRNHPWKDQLINRFFELIQGKISLKPPRDDLAKSFNEQAGNLMNLGVSTKVLRTYFEFRGLIAWPTQS